MTYELTFLEDAYREWQKLAPSVRQQFSKKLKERLEMPHVPSARLHSMPDCYKIKLRDAGYRLVYRMFEGRVTVQVVAVGKRDKNRVYVAAATRVQ